jgi:hypothetical protein
MRSLATLAPTMRKEPCTHCTPSSTNFLRSSLPWEPSVWLDERSLNTEGDVKQQIREGLRDAAVLISITSETVESRKWCRDEMGWFLTGADLDRVIVERLYPVFLPFSDPARLPRWSKDMFTLDMFILDRSDRNYSLNKTTMHIVAIGIDCTAGCLKSRKE